MIQLHIPRTRQRFMYIPFRISWIRIPREFRLGKGGEKRGRKIITTKDNKGQRVKEDERTTRKEKK